jgi:uncharacterized repeat protein (TIGR03803 family)
MSKLVNYRARLRAGVVLTLAPVAAFAAGSISPALAKGDSYEILYNFAAGTTDGGHPMGQLLKDKSSGNLYGTTAIGGAYNGGTIFEITPSGTETVLYSLSTSTGPDAGPNGGTLVGDSAGNLYGASYAGGANDAGYVYKFAPGGTFTTLYTFTGGSDGEWVDGGLTLDKKGNLYGTTNSGGANGFGTVFEVAPNGTETVLYSFTGGADGATPQAGLLKVGANFYSVTSARGAHGYGTVFELVKGKKGAWTENTLYSFTGGTDGANPASNLIKDSAGNLYGTAEYGGANGDGAVFELAPNSTLTTLYSFQNNGDGEDPLNALLLAKNGNLYGTTAGSFFGSKGSVFQFASDGTETTLHDFTGQPDGNFPTGTGPLIATGGYLYGTTQWGGANDYGTVYRLKE